LVKPGFTTTEKKSQETQHFGLTQHPVNPKINTSFGPV
jgi:hypothetical protein